MEDLVKQASSDVAEFIESYTKLLHHFGGDDMVVQMNQEIRYRVKMGAELAEALSEHYNHTKTQYRF